MYLLWCWWRWCINCSLFFARFVFQNKVIIPKLQAKCLLYCWCCIFPLGLSVISFYHKLPHTESGVVLLSCIFNCCRSLSMFAYPVSANISAINANAIDSLSSARAALRPLIETTTCEMMVFPDVEWHYFSVFLETHFMGLWPLLFSIYFSHCRNLLCALAYTK